ncbi:MAG TPA: twin-arginine translocation signal domain-containing protein [Candidatus Sulfotelmatobacter sp.]|nr:twin-arginine translocation signal domain-containing protein [Candidatus Sulfotelmatobacter sp.]
MEKEAQISRRDFLKVAAGLTAAVVVTPAIAFAMVETQSSPETLPELDSNSTDETLPRRQTVVEFPKSTQEPPKSPEQIRQEQVQRELYNVEMIMENNPNVFSKKKIKDVEMYYPIYRAVSDKYKLDWYLLFIVHEAETGASAGKRGFAPDSYYKGAMQLDPNIWSNDYINGAAKGLSFLSKIPQRHDDDWKQIAAGGRILSANINKNKKLGKENAVLNALLRYSAPEPALKRFKTYKQYEKLFPSKPRAKVEKYSALLRAS